MIRQLFPKIAAAALSLAAMSSHAGLLGTNVTANFYYPDTSSFYCSNGPATVGAGVEYPGSCSGFAAVGIDVGDTTMSVSLSGAFAPASFNGFELDAATDFLTASYVGGTMGVTDVSIIGGNIWVNFSGQQGGTANFEFTNDTPTVPEPSTLLLMGAGLLAASRVRRR